MARFNAFISYAWRDNVPLPPATRGWVTVFHERLNGLLQREVPRERAAERIWIDYERMRGNDTITPAIRAQLDASELFVPILSPAWLDSPWCRQELAIFLERHGPDSGRIFPVWMEPVDGLPPPLDGLPKYPFWYHDERHQPRTRWFPEPDPTDRDYSRLQQDLARDMGACLKGIAPEPNRPPEPPLRRPQSKHLVLVDGGNVDRPLLEAVAERLRREYGIGYALPLANGHKSSEVSRDRRAKLDLCTAVLLVFRHAPEPQIHGRITDTLKAVTRRPKGRPDLSVDLCRPCGATLYYHAPQVRILECCTPDLDDCADQLAELLP